MIEANEAALEFGGFDREDIIGSPFYEAPWWTHSEDVETHVRDALERAAEGEFVRYETEVRGASGMAVIDFSVKPVADDDGEITLLVVEGRDITEGTRRREHLRVMQRVLRHNMRNDLTKMRGFTEALYQETDEETRTQHFETIEAILDKWADMTEKMRQIRQVLESYQNNQTGVPAGELVDDAVATIEERDTATTVVSEISGGSAIQIPGVITEALYELLENGIEATTGSDARVEARLAQSGDDWVEITVADNGPGMPDAEASVLDTGEETPLNHGQGLGLWMVRMLTKQVGGNVSVDVSHDGTAVTLQVPRSDQLSIPA